VLKKCLLMFLCCISISVSADDYASVFDRFKKLEGVWHGSSTKGWENSETYRVIGKGSAVLSTSEFVDSPEEGMASVITMDRGDLLLTHYCEAKNQPILRATQIEENGKRITFEFAGGTNIPTRDVGHMDRVVWIFEDDDHFSSQWSWYANGKQTLFETVRYERKK
jgi:hypothetical protein